MKCFICLKTFKTNPGDLTEDIPFCVECNLQLNPPPPKLKFVSDNYYHCLPTDVTDMYLPHSGDDRTYPTSNTTSSKKKRLRRRKDKIPKPPVRTDTGDFPIFASYSPKLSTIYDCYSHKAYNLNLVDPTTLHVINKDNNKVVYVCIASEVFWSDHATIPQVEDVSYAISQILLQNFGGNRFLKSITHYRGYKVFCGFTLRRKNTAINKSKSLPGEYKPHAAHVVAPDIRPQLSSNMEFVTNVTNVIEGANYGEAPKECVTTILKIVTHIGAIYTSTPGANRTFCILSALIDLVKSQSVRNLVYGLIDREVFTAQAGELDSLHTIASAVRGPLYSHIDTMICVLVSCGFVDESRLSVGGVNMFSTGFSKHSTGRDIFAKVLEAVHYLGTIGHECFEKRSFEPLMNMRDDLLNFSKNVNDLHNALPCVIQGNYLTMYGRDESYFEDMLTKTLQQCTRIETIYSNASAPIVTYVRQMSARLNAVNVDFHMDKLSRGNRVRPLCIKFYGDTGVGKSYLNHMTILEVLKSNNFPSSPSNICTVTDEKFDSTVKSNSTGIVMDDMCNTRAEHDDINPAAKLIRFINNVCAPAVKADVQDKGKVLIMPKVVGITTNCRQLAADYWSINKGSILRRCDIHVDTYIRPEFAKLTGILDSAKVHSMFEKDELNDIYLLRVMQYDHVKDELVPFIYDDLSGRYPELHGKPMNGVSIFVFWEWLYDFSRSHFEQQTRLHSTMISSYTAPRCLTCNRHSGTCACTALVRKFDYCGEIPDYSSVIAVKAPPKLRSTRTSRVAPAVKSKKEDSPPPDEKMEAHSGIAIPMIYQAAMAPIRDCVSKVVNKCVNSFLYQFSPSWIERSTLGLCDSINPYDYLIDYHDRWYSWNNIVPKELLVPFCDTWFGKIFTRASIRRSSYLRAKFMCAFMSLSIVPMLVMYRKKLHASVYPAAFGTIFGISSYSSHLTERYLSEKLLSNRVPYEVYEAQTLSALRLTEEERSKSAFIFKWAINAFTLGAVASIALHALNMWRSIEAEPNSALAPENEEEFTAINNKGSIWSRVFSSLDIVPSCKTNTQFTRTISKNLRHIILNYGDDSGNKCCNAVYLRVDELMLPKHVFYPNNDITSTPYESIKYKLTRAPVGDPNKPIPGSTYADWKEAKFSDIRELSTDWVVLITHGLSGNIRNLTLPDKSGSYYFPKKSTLESRKLATSVYRKADGDIQIIDTQIESYGLINVVSKSDKPFSFFGAKIVPKSRDWKNGDCGTVLIDRSTKDPKIIGFHIYGRYINDVLNQGVSVVITQEDIDAYLEKYKSDVMRAHCISDVPSSINGKNLFISDIKPAHSPSNFVPGTYEVLGYIQGSNHYVTDLKKTKLYDAVVEKHPSLTYAPPDFKHTRPFDDFLRDCTTQNRYLDHRILDKCVEDYVAPLENLVRKNTYYKKFVKPLSNTEIINGVPDVRFLDRMCTNSAMGFPYTGKRSKFLHTVSNDKGRLIQDWNDQNIWKSFEEYHDVYRSGEILSHPFKSSLKDELRNISKLKPRVFQAAPLFLQLFIRKYFLPLAVLLSSNPLLSECAVGINPMSHSWEELMSYVESFGTDTLFAGDYSKWDTTYEKELADATYKVLLRLARSCGYSDDDLFIMEGICTDLKNVVLLLFGTIFRVVGPNPSGQNMTTYVNSIGNSLKVRYITFELNPLLKDFRSHAHVTTYGDDILLGVKRDIGLNFNSYRNGLAKYNISFTLPTKEKLDTYPDFLPPDMLDFLKRKSNYIDLLGFRIGSLELSSIWKSLLYYNPKSPMSQDEILKSTIESASYELAAHGKEVYDEGISFLKTLSELIPCHIPILCLSFEDKINRLKDLDTPLPIDYSLPEGASEEEVSQTLSVIQEIGSKLGSSLVPGEDAIRYDDLYNMGGNSALDKQFETVVDSIGAIGSDTPIETFYPMAGDSTGDAVSDTAAVTSYSIGDDGMTPTEASAYDATKYISVTPDISLSEYLARPVWVANLTWDFGVPMITNFNPVQQFLNDSGVKLKLQNYAFISGRVHVKAMVNGSAFHYGKAIMAYEPYGVALRVPHYTQLTCLPYVSLSPNDDSGGTLSFDIMHQHNFVDMTASRGTIDNVARIWIDTINQLAAVGATTTPVTVIVHVWMTDVTLSMATSGVFAPQSGEMEMTSKEAPKSDVLSRIYKMPYIGKYVKATSVALTAGSEIATLFGYSKPCVYHDDIRAVPYFTGNMTHFNAYDSSTKLSLDHKAEVFVDNTITGSPDAGEMDIVSIAKREMLIQPMTLTGTQSTSTSFFQMNVTPSLSVNTGGYTILSPMAHVATAFRHWRGTMKIRVEIVASPFHRGKLRVCYDPRYRIASVNNFNSFNKYYSHVIDLSESREYTFCIGWGTNRNYLFAQDPIIPNVSLSANLNPENIYHNGQVSMQLLTPLTAGLTTSAALSVYVNVYASMCDDFEVAQPWGTWLRDKEMYITPTSIPILPLANDIPGEMMEPQAAVTMELPKTDRDNEVDLCLNKVPMYIDDGKLSGIHHGERIRSLRQLLKRYCFVDSIQIRRPSNAGSSIFRTAVQVPSLPFFRRYTNFQPNVPITPTTNYCIARNTFITWFLPSYVGFRGGMRWKYVIMKDANIVNYHDCWLNYQNSANDTYSQSYVGIYEPTDTFDQWFYNTTTYATQSENGQALGIPSKNPVLEFEVPYYGVERFKRVESLDWADPDLTSQARPTQHAYSIYYYGTSAAAEDRIPISRFFAAGDDFSLVYYKYAPIIYVRNTPYPA